MRQFGILLWRPNLFYTTRPRVAKHAHFLSIPRGAVAQLGERLTGSQEVRSSILLGSTNRLFNART